MDNYENRNIKNYVLFPSHSSGLALEGVLKTNKIKYVIVPTPRELSTCCGISMEYSKADEEAIKELVEKNNIKVLGFYSIEKKYKNIYG